MNDRSCNLLDEAVEGTAEQPWKGKCKGKGKVVLIEDSVETSGSFVLHQLIKRALSAPGSSNFIIFLAFSHPFYHYDRILRKLGCSLVAQRENGRFFFIDKLTMQCPETHSISAALGLDRNEGKTGEGELVALFWKIQNTIRSLPQDDNSSITIMIDDISLIEVAAHGSSDHVLDFLHYCHALTSESGCSLVTLNHMDIYSNLDRPTFILQMEYLADVLIKVEPLATGLAADVHGQVIVVNRGISDGKGSLNSKISNFHFKVKENGVEFFYPGSQT